LCKKKLPENPKACKNNHFKAPDWLPGEVAVILKKTTIQAGKAYLGKKPVDVEVTIGGIWAEKREQAPGT
jgi:hypothetical protein